MENIETKGISSKEFYELIKSNRDFTNANISILNDVISSLKSISQVKKTVFGQTIICSVPEMAKLLETNAGKVKFIKILKSTFGYNFFDELNSEEIKNAINQNKCTKYNLDRILTPGFGTMYGYDFKKPENWDEFVSYIQNCFNVYKDSHVIEQAKMKYHQLFLTLKTLFESTFLRDFDLLNKYSKANKFYEKFMQGFEKKVKINLTEEEIKEIKSILNLIDSCFYDENDGKLTKLEFGDAYIQIITNYNEAIDKKIVDDSKNNNLKKENKNDKKTEGNQDLQTPEYFKILKQRIKKNQKITDGDLPSYENENFKSIMMELFNLFLNEKNASYTCAVLSAHILAYKNLQEGRSFSDADKTTSRVYK